MDAHALQTLADALERHVSTNVGIETDDDDEPYVEFSGVEARDLARDVLSDLDAAGFIITRKERA